MKKIMILANKYPNEVEPNVCVFIQQLVWSFADLGYQCVVVAPAPIDSAYWRLPKIEEEITENGNVVKIYHPKYVSLGQSGVFLKKYRVKLTTLFFERSIYSLIEKEKMDVDIFYSHFLCPAGVAASRLGKKFNKPAFMAHGEALYSGDKKYGNEYLKKELQGLTGVIAVSSQNKDYVVNAGIVKEEIVNIFPNGYREERFFPRNKFKSRQRLGFPQDKFIVGFCGSFDDRKGILRLEQAVNELDEVYFVCAGKGYQIPSSEKCLFAETVNNNDLPYFYSSLDVFVLPTQNEGCCNAIVEAIACGCPIISSNRSFNFDICDSSNSILVDPDNVGEIKSAILKVFNDPLYLDKLSKGSLEMAKKLSLNKRAKKIINFMESNL